MQEEHRNLQIWQQTKKEKMPYPICSVVAVFMMLVRILNTLPSRIWDRAFFLFSGYSKSTVDEKGGFSRWLWLFGKLIYPFFSIATIIELFAELQGNYSNEKRIFISIAFCDFALRNFDSENFGLVFPKFLFFEAK